MSAHGCGIYKKFVLQNSYLDSTINAFYTQTYILPFTFSTNVGLKTGQKSPSVSQSLPGTSTFTFYWTQYFFCWWFIVSKQNIFLNSRFEHEAKSGWLVQNKGIFNFFFERTNWFFCFLLLQCSSTDNKISFMPTKKELKLNGLSVCRSDRQKNDSMFFLHNFICWKSVCRCFLLLGKFHCSFDHNSELFIQIHT